MSFSTIPNQANITTNDVVVDTIDAMRVQEETGYQSQDYLCLLEQSPCAAAAAAAAVDSECRFKMAEWYYQVVDFCGFSRESVAIAMSCLDRFLSTKPGQAVLLNRKMFQLAAITCLYTAIKIHEPEVLSLGVVIRLTQGAYTKAQVMTMESTILSAIQWRVNPPTALSFVRSFLELIPIRDEEEKEALFKQAKFQTELVVNEYCFVGIPASTIALAAIENALQSSSGKRGNYNVKRIMKTLGIASRTNVESEWMLETKRTLLSMLQTATNMSSSGMVPARPTSSKSIVANSTDGRTSPRCVVAHSQ